MSASAHLQRCLNRLGLVCRSYPNKFPLIALALAAGWLSISPGIAQTKGNANQSALYSLETNCLIQNQNSRCTVEASDGKDATLYRVKTQGRTISFRLIDSAVLRGAQLWDTDQKKWVALDRLSLDFKNNQMCINGNELCLTNPNYFASLRQDYPNLKADLIVSRFNAADGRLSAICYSQEACDAGF